ncbi:MAG TPA: class I adenylate-forming enzyme family protein [Jatrophihabitans sp.]|nr:class I adenylate-forming enzyme family protein [Jatrophihabitans sp.]
MSTVTRAALAAHPEIGAGNVLSTLLALGADPAGPGLTFDTAVEGYPAEHPLTLGELDERVAARAAWLHQRGIGPRDPVAIWSGTAADHILGFLALTRLGAIPALINGNLAPEIVAGYVGRLRAVATLTDDVRFDRLAGLDLGGAELLGPLGSAEPAEAPAQYRHHRDDPVVITHTSGTTGIPKAVLHSHSTIFAATRHLLAMPQAQGTRRILNALPAAHTATVIMTNQALGNRAEFYALSTQSGEAVLSAIERWRPEGVFGFSATWAELARIELSGYDLDCVRLWFNTGDSTHEPHVRHLVAVGSHDVVTRDGVTRTAGSHFIDGLGSSEMGHSMFHLTHRPDTDSYDRCIGRPYRFVQAAVLDSDGTPLPDGVVGHLGIRSPSLSPGYWNDSVNTFRSRLGGYYITGDLVRRDPDGRFFHLDRAVDAVTGPDGTRYYTALSEERILSRCPDVRDCTVVISREGEQVSTEVFLELAEEAAQPADLTERVGNALGEQLAATVRRVAVTEAGALPKGATGKVRKVALRDQVFGEQVSA